MSFGTPRPWTAQQFRNLSVLQDELPRYLLHDRDSKFTAHGDVLLGEAGSKVIRLPVQSPNLNAYAERWVRTATAPGTGARLVGPNEGTPTARQFKLTPTAAQRGQPWELIMSGDVSVMRLSADGQPVPQVLFAEAYPPEVCEALGAAVRLVALDDDFLYGFVFGIPRGAVLVAAWVTGAPGAGRVHLCDCGVTTRSEMGFLGRGGLRGRRTGGYAPAADNRSKGSRQPLPLRWTAQTAAQAGQKAHQFPGSQRSSVTAA